MVSGTIVSEIGFYIGDVCYALSSDNYEGSYGVNDYEEGIYETNEGVFAVGDTAFGDGEYTGEDGYTYTVDAGNIGIVPIELVESGDGDISGGRIISVPGEADFSFEDGLFWFSLPNGEEFYIDTHE